MKSLKSTLSAFILLASISPSFAQVAAKASDESCAAVRTDLETSTSRLTDLDRKIRQTSDVETKQYLGGRREELSSHIEKMQNLADTFCANK